MIRKYVVPLLAAVGFTFTIWTVVMGSKPTPVAPRWPNLHRHRLPPMRVMQLLYSFERGALPVYVGQQMDVFIEAPPLRDAPAATQRVPRDNQERAQSGL